MPRYYEVSITKHDDAYSEASFYIEPPITFLTPEMTDKLSQVVRNIIRNRMEPGDDTDLEIAITHTLPDNSATVGRAHFDGLKYGMGVVVLQQALELGLNGTNEFVSPNSPLVE